MGKDLIDRLQQDEQERLLYHALEFLKEQGFDVSGVGKYSNCDRRLVNALKRKGMKFLYRNQFDPQGKVIIVRFWLQRGGKVVASTAVKMIMVDRG